jgi:outer membrane biosynthesis protein TonB
MSSKSSAIGKGILVGAAAGAALYVMWRRSRARQKVHEPPFQAPERPAQAAPEPAWEAFAAPAAEPPPAPSVEPEVVEPEAVEPEAVEPAAVEPEHEPEPVAEEPPEPVFEAPAPEAHPPPAPVAEHGARRPGLSSPGRPRDFSPGGWPQPTPLGASGGVRRPAPVSARATWPGVAGAGQMRPTTLRRIPPRGGGPLHRAG